MNGGPPDAVAFDVNETLTDLAPLTEVFARWGLEGITVRWWFAVLLRDGFAVAATGGTALFSDLAEAALDELAAASGRSLPRGAGDEVADAWGRLSVHRDVLPALERLRAAGIPAFALTNGSVAPTRQILAAAGVVDLFTGILSVDDVGHWKPRPEPYRYLAEVAGVSPERVALVAVHPWDLHGAASAGLTTGWANRDGRRYPSMFRTPTVQSAVLDGVIERLVALGGVQLARERS